MVAAAPRRTPRSSRSLAATATCLVLAATTACGGGPSGPVDGARAHAHLRTMVGFGPRPFGSDALAKTADHITAELTKLGLSPQRHELVHAKEKKTIRNLYVQIDGEDPQQGPILMLAAHYDTKLAEGHADAKCNFPFVGAIDGGGAPALLLELARVLKERPQKPRPNVWLYWIDAEESVDWTWNDERALLGSQAFCAFLGEQKILPRVKAFVLLDLIGDENWKLDKDGNSVGKLQTIFLDAAKEIGVQNRLYEFPTQAELEFYRQRGVDWGTKDDHLVFTRHGVPSVLLIDFARRIPEHLQDLKPNQKPMLDDRYVPWWHTADDDLAQTSPDTLAAVGNLVMAAWPRLEDFALGKR
jgi:glutaminyl-peptide cyclotransferase